MESKQGSLKMPRKYSDDIDPRLRKKAGQYIQKLREDADLTQHDLSKLLGLKYYTYISQVETGQGRLADAQYEAVARALGVDCQEFARQLTKYYHPTLYRILFDNNRSHKK